MILVICAAAAELRGFSREGVEVVPVGVGPVEAAIGTFAALAGGTYGLVVNAGIGGGFDGRAAVGDAVAVTRERYVELGREDRGDLHLPGGLRLADDADCDAGIIARLSARTGAPGPMLGSGITSATITTSAARAQALADAYAPFVESMEGFAVLRAAALAGIRAVEVRGISNIVGERATSGWDFRAGASATVHALNVVLDVVETRV